MSVFVPASTKVGMENSCFTRKGWLEVFLGHSTWLNQKNCVRVLYIITGHNRTCIPTFTTFVKQLSWHYHCCYNILINTSMITTMMSVTATMIIPPMLVSQQRWECHDGYWNQRQVSCFAPRTSEPEKLLPMSVKAPITLAKQRKNIVHMDILCKYHILYIGYIYIQKICIKFAHVYICTQAPAA